MATLYITEFASAVGNGRTPIAQAPAVAHQTVAIGAEADSAAFNPKTTLVRLHCDAICSVKFDDTPTATTSTMRLAADQTEYFGVQPGSKVSVISNT